MRWVHTGPPRLVLTSRTSVLKSGIREKAMGDLGSRESKASNQWSQRLLTSAEARKSKERFSPGAPRQSVVLNTLVWVAGLQKCEWMGYPCWKPPSLWYCLQQPKNLRKTKTHFSLATLLSKKQMIPSCLGKNCTLVNSRHLSCLLRGVQHFIGLKELKGREIVADGEKKSSSQLPELIPDTEGFSTHLKFSKLQMPLNESTYNMMGPNFIVRSKKITCF